MRKKYLSMIVGLSLGLTSVSYATPNFVAVIEIEKNGTTEPSVPLFGWYGFLENHCFTNSSNTYPDLSSWEKSGKITCNGSNIDLPTIGDLSSVKGVFNIGNASNYINVLNDEAFKGLRTGKNINFYLKGEGAAILNDYQNKKAKDSLVSFQVDDLHKLELTDVSTETLNIEGKNTGSKLDELILNLGKTKTTKSMEMNVSNVIGTNITTDDSLFQNDYVLNVMDSKDLNINIDNVSPSDGKAAIVKIKESTINDAIFKNFDAHIEIPFQPLDKLNPNENDMKNLIFDGGVINGSSVKNVSNIENIIIKNLHNSYLNISNDDEVDFTSKIENITINNISSVAPILFDYISEIGTISVTDINQSDYFSLKFGDSYYGDWKYGENIDSFHFDNVNCGSGDISIHNYKNVNNINLDNIQCDMWISLKISKQLGFFKLNNSNYENFVQIKAGSVNDFIVENSFVDNYFELIFETSANNVIINDLEQNNYFQIDADTIDNFTVNKYKTSNFLDIDAKKLTNNIQITDSYVENFITINNANNITIDKLQGDHWIGIDSDNEIPELNLTIRDVQLTESSGYLRVSGYNHIKEIDFSDSSLSMGLWIDSEQTYNSNLSGDIEKLTMKNITTTDKSYNHSLSNINNIKELNLISDDGYNLGIIRFNNVGSIDMLNISNSSSNPIIFNEVDDSLVNNFSIFSENENINIIFNGSPVVNKLDNNSAFCSNYNINTVAYSYFDFNTNTGTLVDKSTLCE